MAVPVSGGDPGVGWPGLEDALHPPTSPWGCSGVGSTALPLERSSRGAEGGSEMPREALWDGVGTTPLCGGAADFGDGSL